MADSSFIPFHRPSIGPEEIAAVERVLASRWLTTGPVALQFERDFAAYVGCKHALAVNSGTAALQLALDAIGLRAGDEVLVPTYTFTATAEVTAYFGARPRLCDSVKGGFNIDVTDAERRITPRTRAIIPVHIAGQPCALKLVRDLADRYGLSVIEDAAHALPASYRGARIGSDSRLAAFSFYANKNITTGEGGMVVTNNDDYASRIDRMRLHGIARAWNRYSKEGSWFYQVENAGYKLNMPDVLAALGVAQLARCDQLWHRRCSIVNRYNMAFRQLESLVIPPEADAGSEHSWHLYIVRIRHEVVGLTRNEVIEGLKEAGVGSSVHFIPLHLHPYYQRTYGYRPGDFPNAEDAYSCCLSLPLFPELTDNEIDHIIDSVVTIVTQRAVCRSGYA